MLNRGLEEASPQEFKKIEKELELLCNLLQTNRQKIGISQERLAEILGVNINTIKYIEQGRRIPSLPMLYRICWALGLTIEFKNIKKLS